MKRSAMPSRRGYMKRSPLRLKPRPGAGKLRRAARTVHDRADGACEIHATEYCHGLGDQAHHVIRRSQGGTDTPDNLLWTCEPCHIDVHANPSTAFAMGWLRHGWEA